MAKRRRTRYTDKQRAAAVALLEGAGYPKKEGALSEVAKHTGIPAPTLYRWFTGQNNPPPSDLVNEKEFELADLLKAEIESAVKSMAECRDDANYRDLGVVIGILVDKLQLISGKPTVINEERAGDARSKLADLINRRSPVRGENEFTERIN